MTPHLLKVKTAQCKGDDMKSPHPLIYMNMGKENTIICPYCGQKYVYDAS